MLEKLINAFKQQDDVKLVIWNENLEFPDFFVFARKFTWKLVVIPASDHEIIVMRMTYRVYLKFMKELQLNGMNLKEVDDIGLVCKLVSWNK